MIIGDMRRKEYNENYFTDGYKRICGTSVALGYATLCAALCFSIGYLIVKIFQKHKLITKILYKIANIKIHKTISRK